MVWPFKQKQPALPSPNKLDEGYERQGPISIIEEKGFDWAHYQAIANGGIQQGYQDEYNFIPTVRVLKSLYAREPWVNLCVNAISKQFMRGKHVLTLATGTDGEEQIITQHPLITYLSSAGKENPAFFTCNNIIDMVTTGNAYSWIAPQNNDKKRLPAERVDIHFENGVLQNYEITNPEGEYGGNVGGVILLQPDEVLHFRMPNPYSPWVGMSLLMAINLPVLVDKYGREFVVGFFLRGGQSAGIIQTDSTNADQLTRFAKTIMAAIGGRRNTHSDKILPKGATWAQSVSSFSDIQLIELMSKNETMFRAATGVTNTVLGISENINRATAYAEMENFWKTTILPLQFIYCSAIKQSSLWRTFGLDQRYDIKFDNSHVEYLDDWDLKLENDAKLKPVATVNERRERLGMEPIERLGDKFEVEMQPKATATPFGNEAMALPAAVGEVKAELPGADPSSSTVPEIGAMAAIKAELPLLQDPTSKAESYFQREFARWEDITMANLDDPKAARKIIEARAEKFAQGFAEIAVPEAMKIYDFNIARLKKAKSFSLSYRRKATAEEEQDRAAKLDALKARGKRVIAGKVLENGKKKFQDYSMNNMERIHGVIADELDQGKNLDDVAVAVRAKFGEFYEGQAKTIVRTEFASAMAEASYQFGNDLATIAEETTKTWVSMDDSHTRDDHLALDGAEITGKADEVSDMYFEVDGKDYLRYPKDENGDAAQVVNCRCDMVWDVVKWGQ